MNRNLFKDRSIQYGALGEAAIAQTRKLKNYMRVNDYERLIKKIKKLLAYGEDSFNFFSRYQFRTVQIIADRNSINRELRMQNAAYATLHGDLGGNMGMNHFADQTSRDVDFQHIVDVLKRRGYHLSKNSNDKHPSSTANDKTTFNQAKKQAKKFKQPSSVSNATSQSDNNKMTQNASPASNSNNQQNNPGKSSASQSSSFHLIPNVNSNSASFKSSFNGVFNEARNDNLNNRKMFNNSINPPMNSLEKSQYIRNASDHNPDNNYSSQSSNQPSNDNQVKPQGNPNNVTNNAVPDMNMSDGSHTDNDNNNNNSSKKNGGTPSLTGGSDNSGESDDTSSNINDSNSNSDEKSSKPHESDLGTF